jgi:hypothetical protein
MTKEEAKEYLKWHREKVSEYNYLARFKSVAPFHVAFPKAGETKRRAKIILGTHDFQRPFEELKKFFPYLTKERYLQQRFKLGIEK